MKFKAFLTEDASQVEELKKWVMSFKTLNFFASYDNSFSFYQADSTFLKKPNEKDGYYIDAEGEALDTYHRLISDDKLKPSLTHLKEVSIQCSADEDTNFKWSTLKPESISRILNLEGHPSHDIIIDSFRDWPTCEVINCTGAKKLIIKSFEGIERLNVKKIDVMADEMELPGVLRLLKCPSLKTVQFFVERDRGDEMLDYWDILADKLTKMLTENGDITEMVEWMHDNGYDELAKF